MSDFYTEQLVKKQAGMKELVLKALLAAVTIVSVLAVFLFPLGFLLLLVMIVLDIFVFRNLNVEYEYLFVNGDIDIDKIMNKSRRKRVFCASAADLEILAPYDAVELRQYQNAKTYNYSSGSGQARLYAMVVAGQGELKKVIFEPNETIVEGFYVVAPRKVIRR